MIGDSPAWYFPNGVTDPAEIAIFVHGRNGIRENGLRFVDAVRDLDLPVLVITYRNDLGTPPDPSGRLGRGATEWPELDAAVAWALDQGANDIVLVGLSMGGGVAAFLENSERADAVSKVVLDAPMLSPPESVEYGARIALPGGLGVPAPSCGARSRSRRGASGRLGCDRLPRRHQLARRPGPRDPRDCGPARARDGLAGPPRTRSPTSSSSSSSRTRCTPSRGTSTPRGGTRRSPDSSASDRTPARRRMPRG